MEISAEKGDTVKNKQWSKEEEQYLSEHYGVLSIKTIAKNLGRSENSILVKRTKQGLGRFLESGEYISYSQLLMALYGSESVSSAYRNNMSWEEFPLKTKKVHNCSFKVVYLDDFWEWAKENKRKIDFSKMPENILGAEPDWVKKKRKIDFACRFKTTPWTKTEDTKLERMLMQHKYTYTDLSAEFQRSEGAIRRRIWDLALDIKPVRAVNRKWTPEETAILVFMYDEGWSLEKIGAKLGRTGQSCRGKIQLLNNPDVYLRENRKEYRPWPE